MLAELGVYVEKAPDNPSADLYLARQALSTETTTLGGTGVFRLKEGQSFDVRVFVNGTANGGGAGLTWIRVDYLGDPDAEP